MSKAGTSANGKEKPPPNSGPLKLEEFQSFKIEMKEMISSWILKSDKERSNLHKDIKDIKTKLQEVKSTSSDMERSLDYLSKQFEDVTKKVQTLETTCSTNKLNLQQLEEKIELLQRTFTKSSIEIRNVPASSKDKESVCDLSSIVLKIGETLNMQILPSDIRDIFRLPHKQGTRGSGTIVAEFMTVTSRNTLLQAVKSFNLNRSNDEKLNTSLIGFEGKREPIYVSELLVPATKRLFAIARQFSKDNNYKFCWTANGRVFLKKDEKSKQIPIKSETCLNKLLI